ncbi:MAG: extracellular solute-binding protein [Candidatus Scatosoma sp.]
MKKFKTAAMLLLGVTMGMPFTACAKKQSGGRVEGGVAYITFAGRSNDTEKANYVALINDFMEAYPNIVVTTEWYPNESSYMLALRGKGEDLPDMFMLSNTEFISFADSGLLFDYKDYVDDADRELIYRNGYDAYCYNPETNKLGWDASNPDCGFYGLPKDQGPYALVYNKDLFKQLAAAVKADTGEEIPLPSATKPYTYDEFIEVCSKLTEYGTGIRGCAEYDLISAIYSNNANFFNEDATQATIDNKNFIDAIKFYQSLYTEGVCPPYGGTEIKGESAFTSKKAIFYYIGPWDCKDYWETLDFEWDVAPVCVGTAPGAVSTAYVGGMGYCVSASSAVKEYAVTLAKYLALNENSQRIGYQRGQAIPNLLSLADEYCNDTNRLLQGKNPENRRVWVDVVDGFGGQKKDENGNAYTDVITGKYRPEAYTYNYAWYSNFRSYCAGTSNLSNVNLWKGGDVAAAMAKYQPYLQAELDEMWELAE